MFEIVSTMADILGLVGVVLTLMAYFLLSIGRMRSDEVCYHLLNFFGSSLILFSLYFHWNLPAFLVEAAWVMISVIGLIRIRLHRL
jgi:hypothetical protein